MECERAASHSESLGYVEGSTDRLPPPLLARLCDFASALSVGPRTVHLNSQYSPFTRLFISSRTYKSFTRQLVLPHNNVTVLHNDCQHDSMLKSESTDSGRRPGRFLCLFACLSPLPSFRKRLFLLVPASLRTFFACAPCPQTQLKHTDTHSLSCPVSATHHTLSFVSILSASLPFCLPPSLSLSLLSLSGHLTAPPHAKIRQAAAFSALTSEKQYEAV